MTTLQSQPRVLAIDPTTSGFGFAVFEGPERLVDWGTRKAGAPLNDQCLKLVGELIGHYGPEVLVVEDVRRKCSRRCPRIRDLIRRIGEVAQQRGLQPHRISRRLLRHIYEDFGVLTKHELASSIAIQFPELSLRLPPPRKPWMSEDPRLSIFDAAALALAFFEDETSHQSSQSSRR